MMSGRLSWLILLTWSVLAFGAFFFSPDIESIHLQGILESPSSEFLLGQDDLGRSILPRLVYGAQISLMVAISVTLASSCIGIFIGALSAWVGGPLDHFMVRLIDSFMAFPGILLAIALAGLMGPGISNLVIALSVVGWVGFARLTRAQVLSLKSREHVYAARAMGVGDSKIIVRHLLPLIAAPLLIEATFSIANIVIAEAGLSFLGIGIQPPEASWGNMIRDGSRYLLVAPHMVLIPGLALASLVYSINVIGDQLRDRLDQKSY